MRPTAIMVARAGFCAAGQPARAIFFLACSNADPVAEQSRSRPAAGAHTKARVTHAPRENFAERVRTRVGSRRTPSKHSCSQSCSRTCYHLTHSAIFFIGSKL